MEIDMKIDEVERGYDKKDEWDKKEGWMWWVINVMNEDGIDELFYLCKKCVKLGKRMRKNFFFRGALQPWRGGKCHIPRGLSPLDLVQML